MGACRTNARRSGLPIWRRWPMLSRAVAETSDMFRERGRKVCLPTE